MLKVSSVTKSFGGLVAVDKVDFEIEAGEIVGLIGPNGAGKTTLFHSISGVYTPESGTVTLDGMDITDRKPHEVTKLGIARTFQTAKTFNESTALENAMAGALFGNEEGIDMAAARDRAMDALEFVGLGSKAEMTASSFTLADRKLLDLAKALTADPKIILIDEIASGLTPTEVAAITEMLEQIRRDYGISIFWIEHIMDAIMDSTDRIIVLNQGGKIAEGEPTEIQNNEHVIKAYLGESTA